MKITKTYTKTYNISAVRELGTYKDVSEIRVRVLGERGMLGMKSCFCCCYEFQNEDIVHLAFNDDGNNVLFCVDCARKFHEQEG